MQAGLRYESALPRHLSGLVRSPLSRLSVVFSQGLTYIDTHNDPSCFVAQPVGFRRTTSGLAVT